MGWGDGESKSKPVGSSLLLFPSKYEMVYEDLILA